jgi:hypothetical protein
MVIATVVTVILLTGAVAAMSLAIRRRWAWAELAQPEDHPVGRGTIDGGSRGDDDDDGPLGVREPRRPLPQNDSGTAFAAPEDRAA